MRRQTTVEIVFATPPAARARELCEKIDVNRVRHVQARMFSTSYRPETALAGRGEPILPHLVDAPAGLEYVE